VGRKREDQKKHPRTNCFSQFRGGIASARGYIGKKTNVGGPAKKRLKHSPKHQERAPRAVRGGGKSPEATSGTGKGKLPRARDLCKKGYDSKIGLPKNLIRLDCRKKCREHETKTLAQKFQAHRGPPPIEDRKPERR